MGAVPPGTEYLPDFLEEPYRDTANVGAETADRLADGVIDGTRRYLTASAAGALFAGLVALGGLYVAYRVTR